MKTTLPKGSFWNFSSKKPDELPGEMLREAFANIRAVRAFKKNAARKHLK